MYAYYNDNDEFVCEWTRNLIKAKLIPNGAIDNRPIQDIQPDDLKDFTQVHLFSGIAGWAYALQLAGWPRNIPVWTGSCPCQPFSSAGREKGRSDDRHLWPEMLRLISECRPPVIFGEQVAGKLGREWLSGVRADLEGTGYAVGATDLPAASVGAPHIRQRHWWVAHTECHRTSRSFRQQGLVLNSATHQGTWENGIKSGQNGAWDSATEWAECIDSRQRRIEPGLQPLAAGVSRRMEQIRAYGNAIVPQVAAAFIRSAAEAIGDQSC